MHSAILDIGSNTAHLEMAALAAGKPPHAATAAKRRSLPRRPVVAALAATAALPVREEIAGRLRLREPVRVIRGFDRPETEAGHKELLTDAVLREEILAPTGGGAP